MSVRQNVFRQGVFRQSVFRQNARPPVEQQVGMEERRKETVGGEDASRTTNDATKNGNVCNIYIVRKIIREVIAKQW